LGNKSGRQLNARLKRRSTLPKPAQQKPDDAGELEAQL
jgi:hypothetical protein